MTEAHAAATSLVRPMLAALFVPLLLVAPAVALLKWQVAELQAGRAVLQAEIDRLDGANHSLRDLDRVRAEYFARKGVLEVLVEDRSGVARLLNVLGALPGEIRLTSVLAERGTLALAGTTRGAAPIELAVQQLQHAGFGPVVARRAESPADPGAWQVFEIEAGAGQAPLSPPAVAPEGE
jgi:Tfp pilus assembly protein PilN